MSTKKSEAVQVRMSPEERALLAALIERRQKEIGPSPTVTEGGYLRGLVLAEADRAGLKLGGGAGRQVARAKSPS